MSVVVMTMNVDGLSHKEFRSILDEMGVEARPERGFFSEYPLEQASLDDLMAFENPMVRKLRGSYASAEHLGYAENY